MKILTKTQFKAIRLRKRLTVAQMAEQMGYSKESIYKKESGDIIITKRDVRLLSLLKGGGTFVAKSGNNG
jgi:transcriptional regulator with XRE-family HTH domain